MRQLSEEGRQRLGEIAARHGVSFDAVEHLLMAVMAGHGSQAQFNHPDLGGMGQWSQGGMIMVGDMFNNGLKSRVDALCNELSNLMRATPDLMAAPPSFQSQSQSQGGGYGGQQSWSGGSGGGVSLFVPGASGFGNWWPGDLGSPAWTGAQNNLRYAFFPASRRLAIDIGGRVTVYDTGDHAIGGFSQQQGGDQTLSFNSQYGLVRVADLPLVSSVPEAGQQAQQQQPAQPAAPSLVAEARPVEPPMPSAPPSHFASTTQPEAAASTVPAAAPAATGANEDIFDKIERLAGLHAKGILTEDEFRAKKAELLARL